MSAIHPGHILRSELKERGLTTFAFARNIGVMWWQLQSLLDERRPMTTYMGKRLAIYFGNSSEFWERLQFNFQCRSRRGGKG